MLFVTGFRRSVSLCFIISLILCAQDDLTFNELNPDLLRIALLVEDAREQDGYFLILDHALEYARDKNSRCQPEPEE